MENEFIGTEILFNDNGTITIKYNGQEVTTYNKDEIEKIMVESLADGLADKVATGELTINQARSVLGREPVEHGDIKYNGYKDITFNFYKGDEE